jgi:type IV secretory pathway VirB10-like protein
MRLKIELQKFQEQFAVEAGNGKPQRSDMQNRRFTSQVSWFERQSDFDFANGKNVHPQTSAQLFEEPVQDEEQRLQQFHRRVQIHVLFKRRGKISRDQRMLALTLRQPPPAKTFLSKPLDHRNFGNGLPGQPQTYGNPPEKPEDPIQAEKKKRNYLSLFSSNVALTYRKGNTAAHEESAAPAPPTADPNAAQLAELLKPLQLLPPSLPIAQPPRPPADQTQKEESHSVAPPVVPATATGKTYVLFEGTVLETVLINRLDGQFTGPVECLLTNDVYSHDRQHLLIPSGTKLLGETRKVEAFGQTRLAVTFHRLVMPDGFSASLDRFQGLNQIGDAGLRDQVNNHYLRIFGTSLALGAIGAVAEAGTSGALTASGGDPMRQGFAQSTAQSSSQILDKFLNVLPTITIREGHRVKVYLSGDLALPDYANHTMPSNL